MPMFLRMMLLVAVGFSQPGLAACEQSRPSQQIDIQSIDGRIQVINKAQSEHCEVNNNQQDDEHQASHVIWRFTGLACQRGECVVELNGNPGVSEKTLKCDLGSADNSFCRLNVNRLKRYCDQVDPVNTTQCEINYVIKIRGVMIDPSIIIKPRPTVEE